MKNTTLIKIILSLVFVFSSAAAFDEENTRSFLLNELIEDVERIRDERRSLGEYLERVPLRDSVHRRSKQAVNRALMALEKLSEYAFGSKKATKTVAKAIEYELKRSGYLVGANGKLYDLEISKGEVKYLSQEEESRKIISVAMKSLLKLYSRYHDDYLDLSTWIKGLIKTRRYSFNTLMSVLYEVRHHPEFFDFIDLFYTKNEFQGDYFNFNLRRKLFEHISRWPEVMRQSNFSDWAKRHMEEERGVFYDKGIFKGYFTSDFIRYFLTQREVEKKFPEFFKFVDLLIMKKGYYREQKHVAKHILSQEAVQSRRGFVSWVNEVLQGAEAMSRFVNDDLPAIENLIKDVFARRQVWRFKEFPFWLKVAIEIENERLDEALKEHLFSKDQLNKLSEHRFFKLLNKKLTVKALRQAIKSGQWDKAYGIYRGEDYLIDNFIKITRGIQNPSRSKYDLQRAEEALESLSQYSSKKVIEALIEAIEYELKIGEFRYVRDDYYSRGAVESLERSVLDTAVKSLTKVISYDETKNYPGFHKWVTRFIKEANYDTLAVFSSELLSRTDIQSLTKFPDLVRLYIKKHEKEISNSDLADFVLNRRSNLEKSSIYIFKLLESHPFFKRFFGEVKPRSEYSSDRSYTIALYETLQKAIKSGEYSKAYKDHLNEIKSRVEKGEISPHLMRILSTKEAKKPNTCKGLF